MHFSSLNLCRPVLDAVQAEGYDTPTPIQARAIPPVLDGRDLLGCAQTGTGKTAAFALPILHQLHTERIDTRRRGPVLPRVLVLAPTRELASQIHESFQTYGQHTGLRSTVIFGGVSQYHQVKRLQRGVDIVVATPGRLIDLMDQHVIDLSEVEVFVLDEADRMLDMGFIHPIRLIASALDDDRQTLLFSATMPKSIRHLAHDLLEDPVSVSVAPVASTAALIEQSVYMVDRQLKPALLERLLGDAAAERALVFTRTKYGADKLTKRLSRAGIEATAIHGNKSQSQRQRALESFRSGRSRVLVATDVAARGLDVDDVTHVINYELPNEPEAYVHRIGRTGRAGATGIAIALCDRAERAFLRDIEQLTRSRLAVVPCPTDLPRTPPPPRDGDDPRRSAGQPRGSQPARSQPARSKSGQTKSRRSQPASPRSGATPAGSASPKRKKTRTKRNSPAGFSRTSKGQATTGPTKRPRTQRRPTRG